MPALRRSVHTSIAVPCGANISITFFANSTQLTAFQVRIDFITAHSHAAINLQWVQRKANNGLDSQLCRECFTQPNLQLHNQFLPTWPILCTQLFKFTHPVSYFTHPNLPFKSCLRPWRQSNASMNGPLVYIHREIVPPRETVAIATVAIAIVGRGGWGSLPYTVANENQMKA